MSLKIRNDVQAHCTLMRQFSYELEWLPEKDYVPGTQIELYEDDPRSFISWRYVRAEMEKADISFRRRANPDFHSLVLDMKDRRFIFRARLPYGARKGESHKILLTAIPPFYAAVHDDLSLRTIDYPAPQPTDGQDAPAVKEEGSECQLTVVAGPVERFSIYCRPMPGTDGKVRTCLIPEDRFGNPGVFARPVEIRLEWEGNTWVHEVREATIVHLEGPRDTSRLKAAIPMGALAPTENVTNGIRQEQELVVIGNPVWPGPVNGLRAAFGELHWHCGLSSGGCTPIEEALRRARDYLSMDFAAPADHYPADWKWKRLVEGVDAYNEPDDFATFYGWEAGTALGHEVYHFTDPEHPHLLPGGFRFGGSPDERVDVLKHFKDFIAIPHHTNTLCENRRKEDDTPYWDRYHWGRPAEYLRLVEIMQNKGSQERNVYSDAWRGWHQNNHSSVQDALAMGHKLGFTGGSDNHCGWPGRAYREPNAGGVGGAHSPKSVILTGLWTRKVERQKVYDALWERSTWAVWDTRALVHFTVNGVLMGGELEVERGTPLTAHIRLSAEDALQSVEIISNGATVWISSFSELDIEADVPLGEAERSVYFYLRALQRNGGIIYASPVFVSVESRHADATAVKDSPQCRKSHGDS